METLGSISLDSAEWCSEQFAGFGSKAPGGGPKRAACELSAAAAGQRRQRCLPPVAAAGRVHRGRREAPALVGGERPEKEVQPENPPLDCWVGLL